MAYTFIAKPTNTSYTNLNSVGKQQYDQSDISYDDLNVFYDGFNPNMYTNIAKPTNSVITMSAGYSQGLLIPLTRASIIGQVSSDSYTRVAKPTL